MDIDDFVDQQDVDIFRGNEHGVKMNALKTRKIRSAQRPLTVRHLLSIDRSDRTYRHVGRVIHPLFLVVRVGVQVHRQHHGRVEGQGRVQLLCGGGDEPKGALTRSRLLAQLQHVTRVRCVRIDLTIAGGKNRRRLNYHSTITR